MITFCRCFHVLVKYRVVLVWQMDKCAIFGWMEALGRSRAKSGIDCSFAAESSFDYNHLCDWLRQGSGTGCFENMRLRPRIRSSSHSSFWKLKIWKWKRWKMRGKQTQTSASIWQWFFLIRFFHFEPPFPFIKCVTWTFDIFSQRITWNELHENIKRKYHRRSDVSKLFLCLQQKGDVILEIIIWWISVAIMINDFHSYFSYCWSLSLKGKWKFITSETGKQNLRQSKNCHKNEHFEIEQIYGNSAYRKVA